MHSVDVTVPPLGVVVLSTRADGKEFPGKGHLAKFLQELFPEVITTEFEGTLVVRTETSKISAIALELGTQPGEFTTLPVVPIRY